VTCCKNGNVGVCEVLEVSGFNPIISNLACIASGRESYAAVMAAGATITGAYFGVYRSLYSNDTQGHDSTEFNATTMNGEIANITSSCPLEG
jgi:hypothetical protein